MTAIVSVKRVPVAADPRVDGMSAREALVERTAEFVHRVRVSRLMAKRIWVGPSGAVLAGAEVAGHLDAALALLERDGWERVHRVHLPGLDDYLDDVGGARRLLRSSGVHCGASEVGDRSRPGLTLSIAMIRVHQEGVAGDWDTLMVGSRCMDAVLTAGSADVDELFGAETDAWCERRGRTFDEVRLLVSAAAEFARRYGPGVAS